MQMNKILPLLLVVFLFATSFDSKKNLGSKRKQHKAFYNTSYGRFAFDEILIKRKVKNDEFISNIFEDNSLGAQNLNRLIALPDSVFNPRRIRVGNSYGISYKIENNKITANKFIYEFGYFYVNWT